MIVFLDSGIAGILANPNKSERVQKCQNWLYTLLAKAVYWRKITGKLTLKVVP